ncbi:MAG: SMP-30/gluconolactonase/LRE family protein [Planctomycetales bacterium]|nr:SMP-30/gluconolactonase/LRE family protein [Planctomycetales bacterium]
MAFAIGAAVLAGVPSPARAEDPVFESETAELVLKSGAGEGPAWDRELGLLTSGDGNIMRWSPSGEQSVYRKNAGSNGLLFDRQGRLLICEPVRRRVSRLDRDGKLTVLTSEFGGKKYNQPNDITVDAKGRIYFSDPRYGDRAGMEIVDGDGKQVEGVYRIDLDGRVERVITHEVDRPNGVLVTPDDRFLYVADNNNNDLGGARKLWRFDLATDGQVKHATRTLIYDWGDSRGPDGMAIDQKGRLYVAGGLNESKAPLETNKNRGGVYVFSTEGKLLSFVHVPRDEVTNCSFGGEDFRTLYITGGGTLWSIRTKVAGRQPWMK